jgi:hypothetical protein
MAYGRNSGIIEMGTACSAFVLVFIYMLWQFISPHFPWGMFLFQLL